MVHSKFLEKVAEGLFINGFNSSRPDKGDHIDLDKYNMQDLLDACDILRGNNRSRQLKRARSAFGDEQLIALPFDRGSHLIATVPEAAGKTRYCGLGSFCPKAFDKKAPSPQPQQQQSI
eukprot:scaffold311078_cov28-Tisochrysis_lutea.AAC.1